MLCGVGKQQNYETAKIANIIEKITTTKTVREFENLRSDA